MKTTSPARPDTSAALWVWPARPSSPTAGQSSSRPPPRPPARLSPPSPFPYSGFWEKDEAGEINL